MTSHAFCFARNNIAANIPFLTLKCSKCSVLNRYIAISLNRVSGTFGRVYAGMLKDIRGKPSARIAVKTLKCKLFLEHVLHQAKLYNLIFYDCLKILPYNVAENQERELSAMQWTNLHSF